MRYASEHRMAGDRKEEGSFFFCCQCDVTSNVAFSDMIQYLIPYGDKNRKIKTERRKTEIGDEGKFLLLSF